MVKVQHLVEPVAVKCHLGRSRAPLEDNYETWELIKKALIQQGAEWGRFRGILAGPILQPQLEIRDESV